jgi:hypothetical protein
MTCIGISAPRSATKSNRSLILERVHPPRGEDPRHQAAVHRVQRWVLEEDHPRREFHARLDDLEDVAA